MPDFTKISRVIAKLRRLRKAKFLNRASKKAAVSGELMVTNRALTKVEAEAIQKGGLATIPKGSLLKPTNAGTVTGVLTSRTARIAEEKALSAGTRKFPKWIKDAGVVEDAVIVNAKKGSRGWNIAKKAGRFGLEVAAWGVAGYYFDRALDYFLGNEEEGTEGDKDKKGLSSKDAFDVASALADEVHGLENGWPIGLTKNFDLSRDPEFMQIYSDFSEAILRGKMQDVSFASVRALDGYGTTAMALLVHRATEAIKLLAALTENENTLRLLAVQSILSDDDTVVPPMGYQILDDSYIHDDSVEMAAEGHLMNIANFVDDYRDESMKNAFDAMTNFMQVSESASDFIDQLADPKNLASKLAIYLLGSYSNDRFEDVMGMLQRFSVDNDGDDDETAMLNLISKVKQRSYAAISMLNKTI